LTGHIVDNCNSVFDKKTKSYSILAAQTYKDLENKSNEYIEQVEQSIFKVRQEIKNFFKFDKVKRVLFIIGSVSNFIALILLMYFIFFKK